MTKINSAFFKKFTDNGIKRDKVADGNIIITEQDSLDSELEEHIDYDKIEETIKKVKEVQTYAYDWLMKKSFEIEPFYDSELIKNIQILQEYVQKLDNTYPKYLNENKINPQVFFDAKDIVKNATGMHPELVLNSPDSVTGVYNDKLLNFDNGFSMDSSGNIFDSKFECIFSPTKLHQKISFVDFLNKKIVTETGVRIDAPGDIEDLIDDSFLGRYEDLTKNEGHDKLPVTKEIIGNFNGHFLYEEDKPLLRLPVEDLFLGDLFDQGVDGEDIIKQMQDHVSDLQIGMCNFQEIPYGKLNSLVFWGGGERGVKPLASSELSNNDIKFKADGTVLYDPKDSVFRTKRPGCKRKTYKTGHVAMWSKNDQIGVERSIIQYIYQFCNTVGLFNANIPKLVGFKKFKVFPGLCIGGLVEQWLCSWQERISKQINELFQCKPVELSNDLSKTGFEDETYPHGSALNSLEDLDNFKSFTVNERYIVKTVDPKVSGLKDFACGLFTYDPQDKLVDSMPWKYKSWRGKPFNPDKGSVKTIPQSNYTNPLVMDMMNSSASGVDGITRRLMSLQYAYFKKQELLQLRDVEASMDGNLDGFIYEVLDKLTDGIGQYLYLKDSYISQQQQQTMFEDMRFNEKMYEHFAMLVEKGIYKPINLELCKKRYEEFEAGANGTSGAIIRIEYYDFSGYDSDEYLVPERIHIEKYDEAMFAEKHVPREETVDVFEYNMSLIDSINEDGSKYRKIATIRDFINISDYKEAYERDIEDNLAYIKADLEYEEYEPEAFAQCKRRCYYTLNNKKLFNIGG